MQTFESPIERGKAVVLALATDQSGPNVVAGIWIGALLSAIAGRAPWSWVAVTFAAYVLVVVNYSLADEYKAYLEEQKNRVLDPIEDRPRGIE